MSYIAKAKRADKRTVKEFFSDKMAILSRACASREVTSEEFRVLFALIVGYLSNETEWCGPTDERLGQSCAYSTRSVGDHTRSLKAKGWITKKQTLHASDYGFPGLTSCRQVPADMTESESIHVGKLEHACRQVPADICRHTACRTEPSLEPSLEPKKKETFLSELATSKGIQGEVVGSQSATITTAGLFELFWTRYPNRVAKAAAEKAFAPALERAGSLDALLAGIQRYVASKPPETSWLNPASFLNGDRWADQPATVSTPKSSLTTAVLRTDAARLYAENWSAAPPLVPFKKPTDEEREAGVQKAEALTKQMRAGYCGKIK